MIVYISGPYTKGDVAANVQQAMWAGLTILDYGHTPLVPHLSHFLHLLSQRPWDRWLEMDLALVRVSDALIRLEGESEGADREVGAAREQGIPIYYGMREWVRHEHS